MKSKIIVIGLLVIVGALLCQKKQDTLVTVGIIQTASHPALDQVRERFVEELQSLTNDQIHFVVQNAEGNEAMAQSIANAFHVNKKVDSIFAIGTLALQATLRAEKEKPIFVAAIDDPSILRLTDRVCGITDRIDPVKQLELIKSLTPDVETISLLYNTAEVNSIASIARIKDAAKQFGFHTVSVGITAENEVRQATISALNKGDALLVPTDNLIARTISIVAKEARKRNKPLFVSDILLVEKGAFAGCGVNYGDIGEDVAKLAFKVLFEGISPASLGICDPEKVTVAIQGGEK